MSLIRKILALLIMMVVSAIANAAIPVTPSFTSSFISGPTLGISWTSSSGATSYQLERDGSVIYTGNQTTQTIASAGGKTYAHRVKACNAEGCSAWSAVYNASTPSVPSTPASFSAVISGPQLILTWANQYFVTSYEYKRDGASISVNSMGSTAASDPSAVGGKNYTYEMRACINSNCSAWVSKTISTLFTPSVPSPTSITANAQGDVTFFFSSSYFSTRYEVQRLKGGAVDAGIWQTSTPSYVDSTALPSTTYTYNIRACIDTLCSAWAATGSVTTPAAVAPAAPGSISANISGSTINVAWGAATGTNSYELQRSGTSGNIASGLITAYTDTPPAGVTYTYSVRACRYGACSAWVTSTSVRISLIPSTPSFTGSFISGPTLGVSWTASANATSYELERNGASVYTGTSTTQTIMSVGATTYAHRVRACSSDGCSAWSAVYNASTPSVPDAPSSLTSSRSGPLIILSWTTQYFVTSYEFQRNGSAISLSTLSQNTVQDSSAVGAQNYTYTVRACIGSNCSAWAATSISTYFTPSVPSSLSASISGASVRLSWSPSYFSTRYEVQRSGNGVIWNSPTYSYDDATGVGSTAYSYNVRACIDTACSAWVTSNSITTVPDVAPSAPASISSVVISSTIKVDWSSSSSVTTYELQRSGTSGNIASGLITTFTDSPAVGASYIYSVRACKNVTCSAWVTSSPVVLPPAIPGFTGAFVSGPALVVSWTASTGANRYVVKRNGATLCDVSGTSCGNAVGIVAATSYSHVIQACNGSICSDWSAPYSASTPSVPDVPTGFAAIVTGPLVKLSFSVSNPYFSTYEFKRNGVSISPAVDSGSPTIFYDPNAQGAQNYVYEVRACIGANCTTWVSKAFSTYFTPNVPTAPTISADSQTGTVSIVWNPSYFSTRYEIQRLKGGIADSSIWQANSLSYSDTTALPTTVYTYNVRACIDTACSAWTASGAINTPAAVAPAAPSSITSVINSANVDVSWGVSAAANNYFLERNEQPLTSGLITSYQDVAPAQGVEYVYRVKACKYTACSAWVSATKVIVPSVPVINSGGINSPVSLIITWLQINGAARYEVERDGSIVSAANYTSLSYNDTNVSSGSTYSYRVRACAGTAVSTCSNWSLPKVLSMMQSPGNLSASLTGKNVQLGWASAANATSYLVYRNSTLIKTVTAPSLSYTDLLDVAGTYYYTIAACKDSFCSIPSGPTAPVVLAGAPLTPTGLKVGVSGSAMVLIWDFMLGATKYTVERNNQPLASNIGFISYSDATPAPGISYTYRLKACNDNDFCSAWATSLLVTMVGVPDSISASVLGSVIEVKWGDAQGATKYRLMRGATQLTSENYPQANFIDSSATPGQQYTYTVQGCNAYGCGSPANSSPVGLPNSSASSISSSSFVSSSSSSSSTASVSGTIYEAENATKSGSVTATNQTGYTGTGFVNFTTVNGSIEWSVVQAKTGGTTLYFRYANASGSDKPMSVYVNDQLVGSLNFATTSAWNAWTEESIDVVLSGGSNKVRVNSGATPAALVDHLKVVDFVTTTTTFKYDNAGRLINAE